ncbi:MAG: TraB/GumN family protein [Desulfobacterales bacterium]|nr:TraB/GumN family protein [Desulfobacterales bacterium]
MTEVSDKDVGNSEENEMIHRYSQGDREIIIVGTAHVSQESTDLVSEIIDQEFPDTVCIELCESRYQSISQKDKWKNTDIVKVVKEKKALVLFLNLLLASFQRKIAKKLDIKPGQEMLTAIDKANEKGAKIHLADRNIQTTLTRAWRSMGFISKMKLIFQLLFSFGGSDDISAEEIEKMKQEDVLKTLLADVKKTHPVLESVLIDERDQYLSEMIKTAPGKKIVAVVGAGHTPGIKRYWEKDIDLDELSKIPPKTFISKILKWILPIGIIAAIAYGFFSDPNVGKDMIIFWILANGILSGLGALIALGHPLTILSAIVAAPLTSLNPMIAAGWVSGLVEAVFSKPKVKDLESLHEDILSFKGFWRNKVTKILLVVVLTNIGSAIGTMVALPMIVNAIG